MTPPFPLPAFILLGILLLRTLERMHRDISWNQEFRLLSCSKKRHNCMYVAYICDLHGNFLVFWEFFIYDAYDFIKNSEMKFQIVNKTSA